MSAKSTRSLCQKLALHKKKKSGGSSRLLALGEKHIQLWFSLKIIREFQFPYNSV